MVKAGFILLQIDKIKPTKDSSLALLLAAQQRGWQLDYMEPQDLWVQAGKPGCLARAIKVQDALTDWASLAEPRQVLLEAYDVLFIRLEPPVDETYIYAMHILQQAQDLGVLVVNPPRAILDFNEKICATKFPELMPPHLVTANIQLLKEFHKKYQRVVLKPLNAKGGKGIIMLRPGDLNLNTLLERMTDDGSCAVMAQEYIPAILTDGDRRVFIFADEIYPKMLIRIPGSGDFRANMVVGGSSEVAEITAAERAVCTGIMPFIKEVALSFVGLDIIGGLLSEINVTCPTGLREVAAATGIDPAQAYLEKIQQRL